MWIETVTTVFLKRTPMHTVQGDDLSVCICVRNLLTFVVAASHLDSPIFFGKANTDTHR